jgi:hypothetical protein
MKLAACALQPDPFLLQPGPVTRASMDRFARDPLRTGFTHALPGRKAMDARRGKQRTAAIATRAAR